MTPTRTQWRAARWGAYDTESAAYEAGVVYLRSHPEAWMQTQDEDCSRVAGATSRSAVVSNRPVVVGTAATTARREDERNGDVAPTALNAEATLTGSTSLPTSTETSRCCPTRSRPPRCEAAEDGYVRGRAAVVWVRRKPSWLDAWAGEGEVQS